ncbi:MAG TPA: hypothetical protein VGQ30_14305 [Gemmatimonadaceae bacterium]|nr:hypothetical protein [Gemmatimonadaceae bacterium]
MPARFALLIAAASLATLPPAIYAQTRRLKVIREDGGPIEYANVAVEGGLNQITDDSGFVSFGAGKRTTYNVRVMRIGYAPWFGKLELPDTAATLLVTLPFSTQVLKKVVVTDTSHTHVGLTMKGFYDRWMMRQKGLLSAVFIGPEELEFRHPDKITNMLRGLNGVCVGPAIITHDGGKTTGWSTQMYAFSSHSGEMIPNQRCPMCPMAVVIDGQQQYPPAQPGVVSIDRLLDANDVAGIEVYARAGNMPISLQVNDTKCGVIAFWTGSRH